MEAIRKLATKLREQVAKQQQPVLKQFGARGYVGSDNLVTAEAELHQHQKLEKLYLSTRAGKHFQRDIVRGVEGYIVTGSKQVEIGTKLSEDSWRYGVENTCTSGNPLSRAAVNFSRARTQLEKERGNLLKAFGTQRIATSWRSCISSSSLASRFGCKELSHLGDRAYFIHTQAQARSLEEKGFPSKQAEAITEVLNDSLENVAQSFASKAEMEESEMRQELNLSQFKSEVKSSQDHHFFQQPREIEKLRRDMEEMHSELMNEIDEEIHAFKAELETAKYQVMKYCLGAMVSSSAVLIAVLWFGL